MKMKFYPIISSILLLGMGALISCEKNNDPATAEEEFKSDDASHIEAQFAQWDKDGKLEFRTKGFTLNEADDTEVTLCVETWEESVRLFKEWMPSDAIYTETPASLTWDMSDGYGKSQGQAVLSRTIGGDTVAAAKLPSNLRFVRTIRFVPMDKWVENGDDNVFVDKISADQLLAAYYVGNVVHIDHPTHHGTGDFVVMRDFDNVKNEKGLIMRLPKDHKFNGIKDFYFGSWQDIENRCNRVGVVRSLKDIYQKDREFWDPIMDAADFDTRDYHYFCWDHDNHIIWGKNYKKINFLHGDTKQLNGFQPNGRECWVYHFWVEEDKNGVLQLIIK